MLRRLRLAFRVASYAALGAVAAGIACVVFVNVSGVCPRFDEGAVQCVSPVYETIGGLGLLVLLGAVFTGLPAVLALCGLVVLVRDIVTSLRRRGSRG